MKLLYVLKLYVEAKKIRKIKLMNLPNYKHLNGQTDPKMAIVVLSKQTGFNQDSVI